MTKISTPTILLVPPRWELPQRHTLSQGYMSIVGPDGTAMVVVSGAATAWMREPAKAEPSHRPDRAATSDPEAATAWMREPAKAEPSYRPDGAATSDPETATAWMCETAKTEPSHRLKKRDAIDRCMKALNITWRQAEAAYRAMPPEFRYRVGCQPNESK
jgi:RPA family protein